MRYNPIDFQSLRYIASKPGCRGADIARELGVAPTTLQSALDRLIRFGLVQRCDHPQSKRAKAHRLSPDGQAVTAAIRRQDLANMDAVLAALTPSEQAEIVRLIEKVHGNLKTD